MDGASLAIKEALFSKRQPKISARAHLDSINQAAG
jgi:hypothetical protein